mmetsp:Transcript_29847/g.29005  ORF Transcript_29847/g.29005 Transcript_29847/m.29005 type:complete len:224 (+) Transcript_29847:95-766(+)
MMAQLLQAHRALRQTLISNLLHLETQMMQIVLQMSLHQVIQGALPLNLPMINLKTPPREEVILVVTHRAQLRALTQIPDPPLLPLIKIHQARMMDQLNLPLTLPLSHQLKMTRAVPLKTLMLQLLQMIRPKTHRALRLDHHLKTQVILILNLQLKIIRAVRPKIQAQARAVVPPQTLAPAQAQAMMVAKRKILLIVLHRIPLHLKPLPKMLKQGTESIIRSMK